MFDINSRVRLRDNAERIGTVESIKESNGIKTYQVRFLNGYEFVSESRLIKYVDSPKVKDCLLDNNYGGYNDFQKYLTYLKIKNSDTIQNNIYSLNTSRTTFYEYQYKPLMKFITSANRRILICDEVGLGKTIEAGIIMKELDARSELDSILVVVPANLKIKWHQEMINRFGESFTILEKKDFLGIIKGESKYKNLFKKNRFIISIESIRSKDTIAIIEESDFHWDLLILDEAHSVRNNSNQHNVVRALSINCGAIVFLTATPIHTQRENLFNILNILDAQQFKFFDSFEQQLKENEPIIQALNQIRILPPNIQGAKEILEQEQYKYKDNYIFKGVFEGVEELLEHKDIDKQVSLDILVDIQRNLSELHLLGNTYTRTRKRDVIINKPERKPNTVPISFTYDELELYNELIRLKRKDIQDKGQIGLFGLINMQRALSSSLHAFCSSERGYKALLDMEFDLIDESENSYFNEPFQELKNLEDSKLNRLIELLFEIQNTSPSKKVIIFAFYIDTLIYLEKKLRQKGFVTYTMHGRLDIDRNKLISDFRDDKDFCILLSSRVGSEGIDLQFCDTLVNYDLPWNPMEVEQRIGRIDRIGQKSPIIRIFNFQMKDTIDDEIVSRLYDRIKLFESSVGVLEPIMGEIIDRLAKKILYSPLPDDEKRKQLNMELVKIQSERDRQELAEGAAEMLSLDYYFEHEIKKIKNKNRYIAPIQLLRFIQGFVNNNYNDCLLRYDLKSNLGDMMLSKSFIKDVSSRGGDIELPFMHHHYKTMKFTMDSSTAFEHEDLELIHVMHPLIRYIADYYAKDESNLINTHQFAIKKTELENCEIELELGTYFYFSYLAYFTGPRKICYLVYIILKDDLTMIEGREYSEHIISCLIEHGVPSLQKITCDDKEYLTQAYNTASEASYIRITDMYKHYEAKQKLAQQRKRESVNYNYELAMQSLETQLQEMESKNRYKETQGLYFRDSEAETMDKEIKGQEFRKRMIISKTQKAKERRDNEIFKIDTEKEPGLGFSDPVMGGIFIVT